MTGFVQQAYLQEKGMLEEVMNMFFPKWWVPIYRELVAEFTVCDRWFASVSASTQLIRLFVHSATSSPAKKRESLSLECSRRIVLYSIKAG
ncbi:hypothetical protein KSP40_PGU013711 [Platanthera guangdongensis]|uniref:Uncharacterized protein n=1 Tax=Platanthera guangdongensis TaxID=2320717 RepID=A0ABR2LUN6_9ASPA